MSNDVIKPDYVQKYSFFLFHPLFLIYLVTLVMFEIN